MMGVQLASQHRLFRPRSHAARLSDLPEDWWKDLGAELAASKSNGLVELSKGSLKHAERDCHQIMDTFGLTLPVPTVDLPSSVEELKIPILRLRDWLTFVLSCNALHNLCGLYKPDRARERTILAAFWERFEDENPKHQAFRTGTGREDMS